MYNILAEMSEKNEVGRKKAEPILKLWTALAKM